MRCNARHELVTVACSVAHDQSLDAGFPRIGVEAAQSELLLPLPCVDSPADVGLAHPLANRRHVVGRQREPVAYQRQIKELQDLAGGCAAADQLEQLQQRTQRLLLVAGVAIGDAEWQALTTTINAEDSLDVGCISSDVGHEYEDVRRLQVRIAGEGGKQLIA